MGSRAGQSAVKPLGARGTRAGDRAAPPGFKLYARQSTGRGKVDSNFNNIEACHK